MGAVVLCIKAEPCRLGLDKLFAWYTAALQCLPWHLRKCLRCTHSAVCLRVTGLHTTCDVSVQTVREVHMESMLAQ